MKKYILIAGLLLNLVSCNDPIAEEQLTMIQTSELSKYNMKLLPDSPNSATEVKLVIYNDCTYNLLSNVSRNGNIIAIEKRFNSMMKLPCMMVNDTISLGKLPAGTYTVNYELIDLATQPKKTIALGISFKFPVTQ
jgi:hypothetical protein